MKKFNLFTEIIVVERTLLFQAINSMKEFAITYKGTIIYDDFNSDPLIYKGKIAPMTQSGLSPQKVRPLNDILGGNYKIVEDDERVLIKAAAAWQELIHLNLNSCDYDDTSADGISEFSDKTLEDIGWHATEFNINYREIVEVIETQCEGIIFCIEQIEPYQFSGLGFITDLECARKKVFEFCHNNIIEKMATDDIFAKENLTDDEEEAAIFFKAL
jgi:hypothetical protein